MAQGDESLLSPSGIKLYGREFKPIAVGTAADFPKNLGASQFLRAQLTATGARFARIYGFSYEGHYYDLPRPTIFLVHTTGLAVDSTKPPKFRSRAPAGVALTGVGTQDFQFADDIRVWEYDKADYSIRLDVETGPFEQILLEAELDEESIEAFHSGQRARVSGQRARVSGQRARVSGQRARTRDRGD